MLMGVCVCERGEWLRVRSIGCGGVWMCGGVVEVELERREGERAGGTECLLELGQRADGCELRMRRG
jgi:hypothetical protein